MEKNKNGRKKKKAIIVLADGTVVHGEGFGAVGEVDGEFVFNTGMVGYVESITDPSYWGQILIQTYPLIGNYGVNPEDFESDKPKIRGFVVRECIETPSHKNSVMSLPEWLEKESIPGISRVDTRMLTQRIRVKGTQLGILKVYYEDESIDVDELLEKAKRVHDPNRRNLAAEVSTKNIIEHAPIKENGLSIVLMDFGVKKSIILNLLKLGFRVIQVPHDTRVDKIMDLEPDGILVSNGPGDPAILDYAFKTIRGLIEYGIPIFGICLGNQLISLALGASTYKLKFGHRGQNHPCIDLETDRVCITSQNHGFAVSKESIEDSRLKLTHLNVNDGTVEGVEMEGKPVFGVQFHPEASPGPLDARVYFEKFMKLVEKSKGIV
ncbi:MAG: glutamine-hydrolyzing carbamoyl-phosphate synthase small subunit [Crenarchaeota archaeon]|nr:glutamine-hydrolyzing carbamoyl-phosphate synthase small subunit [Thermoproteota archaeon]MDW8033554.1 glutamine-hydrolyzing carbamoyl-phosphate synthase small subunit [Nitrososphaerota archaeon]